MTLTINYKVIFKLISQIILIRGLELKWALLQRHIWQWKKAICSASHFVSSWICLYLVFNSCFIWYCCCFLFILSSTFGSQLLRLFEEFIVRYILVQTFSRTNFILVKPLSFHTWLYYKHKRYRLQKSFIKRVLFNFSEKTSLIISMGGSLIEVLLLHFKFSNFKFGEMKYIFTFIIDN